MSGKTVAGIILILAVINLFALVWSLILTNNLDPVHYSIAFFVNLFVIAFSASALSEKK